jgi:putative endonuclease
VPPAPGELLAGGADAPGSALLRTSPARGRWAEDAAARFLTERLGWRLLARNVRLAGGEIDLVLRDGNTDVFVEVKARRPADGRAAEAVSGDKRRRLGRAAASWAARRGVPAGGCRFDVVTVEGRGRETIVRHFANAFESVQRWGI